jgi:hypothetical protein
MAYDAATGTVVLFGGENNSNAVVNGDTWTWDGTTWTKQHPAAHPPPRVWASMAYDDATGTVVLFGGAARPNSGGGFTRIFGDTWTWDGTTWTQQAPAASPSARQLAAMAYDAATGTVVLFSGEPPIGTRGRAPADTWTWG